MQAGEFEPARQTLEKALALSLQQPLDDPNRKDGRIRHNLGSALYELGRLDDAAEQFGQAEAAFRRAGSGFEGFCGRTWSRRRRRAVSSCAT